MTESNSHLRSKNMEMDVPEVNVKWIYVINSWHIFHMEYNNTEEWKCPATQDLGQILAEVERKAFRIISHLSA